MQAETHHRSQFWLMMRLKLLAELDCKRIAISKNISIFTSIDLDEYLIPTNPEVKASYFATQIDFLVMIITSNGAYRSLL